MLLFMKNAYWTQIGYKPEHSNWQVSPPGGVGGTLAFERHKDYPLDDDDINKEVNIDW